jgi:Ca-activated chloride channel family protein
MHGFPLEISKRLMRELLGNLRPTDSFNVLLFSGGSTLLSQQSLPVTSKNISHAMEVIDRQQGGGGTELLPALRRALALPRQENTSRTLVIATDGYVTVEPEAFELIRKEIGNANFFPFGIGTSVNRFLIEGMARAGAGEPFVITKPGQAAGLAEKFREYVQSPLLTQIKVDFNGFEVYDVEPTGMPDVFAERPVTVYGKWRGKPTGSITLRGVGGDRSYTRTIDVPGVKPLTDNSALVYLWARNRIASLGDDNLLQSNDRRITEITRLALQYNLLTAYTSFIAIDSEIRRRDGEVTTVTQPLPLPEGVSDYAVGQTVAAASRMLAAPAPTARESMKQPTSERQPAGGETAKPSIEAKGQGLDERDTSCKAGSILRLEKITASGGLTEQAVRKIVEQRLEEMGSRCPVSQSSTNPGTLTIKWRIDAGGKVRDVKIVVQDLKLEKPESCLGDLIRTWRFPVSTTRKETTVSASFSCCSPL